MWEEVRCSVSLAGAASKKAGTAKTTRTTVSVRKVKLAKKAEKTYTKKDLHKKRKRSEEDQDRNKSFIRGSN